MSSFKADLLYVGLLLFSSLMYLAEVVVKTGAPAQRSTAVIDRPTEPKCLCIDGNYRWDPIRHVWIGREVDCSVVPRRAWVVPRRATCNGDTVVLHRPLVRLAGFHGPVAPAQSAAPWTAREANSIQRALFAGSKRESK